MFLSKSAEIRGPLFEKSVYQEIWLTTAFSVKTYFQVLACDGVGVDVSHLHLPLGNRTLHIGDCGGDLSDWALLGALLDLLRLYQGLGIRKELIDFRNESVKAPRRSINVSILTL